MKWLKNLFRKKTWRVIGQAKGNGTIVNNLFGTSRPVKVFLFVEECNETGQQRAYITDGTSSESYDLNVAKAQLGIK